MGQGMGFVAGVMLMYLPEEPSFRMLTTLLDERGPNLRRLYLPDLEGLKHQLRALEWLLERHCPRLATHLQAAPLLPPGNQPPPPARAHRQGLLW